MQLGIGLIRLRQISRPAASAADQRRRSTSRIRARFPFPLTDAQDQAVAEIAADLAETGPMNRLLQGDVGSGKTVVALYAALLAVANRPAGRPSWRRRKSSPPSITARSSGYLDGSRVRIALLVGGQTAGRAAGRPGATWPPGTIDLVVGTHALLGEAVQFARLGAGHRRRAAQVRRPPADEHPLRRASPRTTS